MHHYNQVPPQWYPYYAPPFTNGPGQHGRRKGKGKGKAGPGVDNSAMLQQDFPEGTRFCLSCAATGKVVPHNDSRCTTCRKCNAPLAEIPAAGSSQDGQGRKKGKGPGTPDGAGQPPPPQHNSNAANGPGVKPPRNPNDAAKARDALAAAGGVATPDIQFIANFARGVQLKKQGLAEDFPGLSSLTDRERKTMANNQAMLDALLAMPEGDQDKAQVLELTNTLTRLKSKSQAKSGEHEGARLHRILSTLKTTWAKAQGTLQLEIDAAEEALAAAQDRAARAAKAKIEAEALFHKRQEQVQLLLTQAAPIPTTTPATNATTTSPVHMSCTIASLLSQLMEKIEASGQFKTSEGAALPVLEGIKAFSKEIVTTLASAEEQGATTTMDDQGTPNPQQAAPPAQSHAASAAATGGVPLTEVATAAQPPQPRPSMADVAWGELAGNEMEDVVMAAAIGVPEDDSSGAAPVDW